MHSSPDSEVKRKVKIACPCCTQRIDVTALVPLSTTKCPTCGTDMVVPGPERPEIIEPPAKFKIICSNCTQRLDVTALAVGTVLRCPSCTLKLTVPERPPGKSAVLVQAQPFVAVVSRPGAAPGVPAAPGKAKAVIGRLFALAACAACAWAVWHYRSTIFGSDVEQIAATAPAAPTGPNGLDLWAAADQRLAVGNYDEAIAGYRKAEAKLRDNSARRAAVRCQIGATLYLLGKPAEARQVFEDAVPANERGGLPRELNADNFVGAVAQVVLGVVKPDAANDRLQEMPAAATLAHFYLGAQALGEGRLNDAAKWFGDYIKPQPQEQAKWVFQFQDLVRPMVDDLQVAISLMKEIAGAQALDHGDEAAQKLRTLKTELQKTPRREFLLSRMSLIEQDIARLAAALNDDPAIKKARELEKQRAEVERITQLRAQFALDEALLNPTEQSAAVAVFGCDFDAAATTYTSAAGRMQVAEFKKIAEERAALYQRMAALKQHAIALMPKSPYTKAGLTNRRGGNLVGKAAKADAQSVIFVQEFGEVPVAWRDLSAVSLFTLLAYYGDLAAANQPAERAANFIALAWLARDLRRGEMTAYANYGAQLSPSAKDDWARLTGPLPEPPALPGQEKVAQAEDPALATPRIPAFMQAGGVKQALSNTNLPSLLDIIPKAEEKPKK